MSNNSRYTLANLRRALESPPLIAREINRQFHRRGGLRPYNTDGISIFEEDWDNLLILDACRYDMIAAREDELSGQLESRTSRASNTLEFLHANFSETDLADTVYVTANANLRKFWDEIHPTIHDVVDVWEKAGWDDELNTVLPETVNEYALNAHEMFPNKRLVVHYVQPHQPFIGEIGRRHFDSSTASSVWMEVMEGTADFTPKQLKSAFAENLDRVIPHAEKLVKSLPGRTVVTSDHGQMLGERSWPIPHKEWGHPPGVYTQELVDVPWVVYESDNRKDIRSGDTLQSPTDTNRATANERLRHLGYLD
jgi:hypothetical protein